MGKILELRHLKNNVDNQCIPTALYVVLQNQFEDEKRTNLNKISYRNIKNWVDWGANLDKSRFKAFSSREQKYYDELFKGNFNIDRFHLELNKSKDIKAQIDENKYPMLLIKPQYINSDQVEYENYGTERKIRGEPKDFFHLVAVHGYDNDGNFFLFDCDLKHKNDEVLSASNIRCQAPFGVLKKFSQEISNRLYWFELIEKAEETTLTQY